jgi:hypothetical protein
MSMGKLIKRSALTGVMGFSWDLIKTGGRIVAYVDSWEVNEANERRAGFVERSVWKAGRIITIAGERLELAVNGLAVRLGYNDGEVSGLVAWPGLAH